MDLKIYTLAPAEVGWREQLALWIAASTMYFGFNTKEEYSENISNSYRLNYYNQRAYGV